MGKNKNNNNNNGRTGVNLLRLGFSTTRRPFRVLFCTSIVASGRVDDVWLVKNYCISYSPGIIELRIVLSARIQTLLRRGCFVYKIRRYILNFKLRETVASGKWKQKQTERSCDFFEIKLRVVIISVYCRHD